jgi:hypothetical protein
MSDLVTIRALSNGRLFSHAEELTIPPLGKEKEMDSGVEMNWTRFFGVIRIASVTSAIEFLI